MLDTARPSHTENIIPFLAHSDRPLNILVVEDDRLQRAFLEERVRAHGHDFCEAENGVEALSMLRADPSRIDIVLMDRIMPLMDGLTAVQRMKDDPELRKIPVIMVTGATSTHDIQEGLEAGVFYYLNKPVDTDILGSVLAAAVREVEQNRVLSTELKRQRVSFNLVQTAKFHLRTLEEAECLAAFAAHCFPEPERVLHGLAELLINAVEHGTLEIGYERKTTLIEDGTWRAEIERRLADETYQHKYVEVTIARRADGVYVVITDQGAGFDWQRYLTIDPARAGDNHGRGIAQARALSFDKLTYNEQGNQVVAFSGYEKKLDW